MKVTYSDLERQLMYRRRSRGADEITGQGTRRTAGRGRMNRGTGGVVALLGIVFLAGCTPSVTPVPLTLVPVPAASEVGQVVAVVDGRTIDVATEDGTVRVRLIGIDTSEIGRGGEASECYAAEARTFLDDLL